MAIAEIENDSGKLKVLFYPNVFNEFSSIIRVNNLIFVKGKIKKEGDEIKIVADDVANINNVKEKFLKQVEINLKIPLGEEKIIKMKEIFTKFKGNFPVIINIISDEKRAKIKPRRFGVEINEEFIEEMKRNFGEESLYFTT